MLTGIYQGIPVIMGIVAYYLMDIWLTRRFKAKHMIIENRDWVNTIVTFVAVIFIVIQPAVMPWLGLYTTQSWGLVLQGIGLVCFMAGLVLIAWVRFHLKQYFSELVELQPDHHLVNTGPYAWVRHPLYSAFLLITLGLLLINPSLVELLLLCFAVWHFSNRAKQEEVLLSRDLPGYVEYAASIPPFIPSFWKKG